MRAHEVLLELDVINTGEIKLKLEDFAANVSSAEAKNWFMRSVFRYMINGPRFNKKFSARDASRWANDPSLHPAVRDKVQNWQDHELFVFKMPTDLQQQLLNISHWIAANEQDDRFRRQLARITFPVATQKAKEWNLKQTAESSTSEGVEVVRRYPDGYHWVRYIDPQVMKNDGKILQNCLGHGTYAHFAGNDSDLAIYSLRDASHKPHVAIAVEYEQIVEAKGKQNDVIAEKYRKYTVDFLNHLDGPVPTDPYLRMADIVYRNGRFVEGEVKHRIGDYEIEEIPFREHMIEEYGDLDYPPEFLAKITKNNIPVMTLLISQWNEVIALADVEDNADEVVRTLNTLPYEPSQTSRQQFYLQPAPNEPIEVDNHGNQLSRSWKWVITSKNGVFDTIEQQAEHVNRGQYHFYQIEHYARLSFFVNVNGYWIVVFVTNTEINPRISRVLVPDVAVSEISDNRIASILNAIDYPPSGSLFVAHPGIDYRENKYVVA